MREVVVGLVSDGLGVPFEVRSRAFSSVVSEIRAMRARDETPVRVLSIDDEDDGWASRAAETLAGEMPSIDHVVYVKCPWTDEDKDSVHWWDFWPGTVKTHGVPEGTRPADAIAAECDFLFGAGSAYGADVRRAAVLASRRSATVIVTVPLREGAGMGKTSAEWEEAE